MERESRLFIVLPEKTKKEFKVHCTMNNLKMSEVTGKLIEEYLKKQES
jgi:hypothetical protein